MLADTLGSVFVIISTLLIQNFGWQWVDPLCSLILSMLILGSVIPLLKSSASILLQSVPEDIDEKQCEKLLNEVKFDIKNKMIKILKISHMEGVLAYSNFHCWQLKSGSNVCSLEVQAHPQINEQILRHKIQQLWCSTNHNTSGEGWHIRTSIAS